MWVNTANDRFVSIKTSNIIKITGEIPSLLNLCPATLHHSRTDHLGRENNNLVGNKHVHKCIRNVL